MKAMSLLLAVFFFVFLNLNMSAHAQLGDLIQKKAEKKSGKRSMTLFSKTFKTIGLDLLV